MLFAEARAKSRSELEELLAARYPRADVAPKVQPLGNAPASHPAERQPVPATGQSFRLCCPGTAPTDRPRIEPLSAERYRYEFSAGRGFGQCTFTDADGHRCAERRFVTIEHIRPFAFGGPSTLENLSLLCSAHNAHTSRQVFGDAFIEEKRARAKPTPAPNSEVFDKVRYALRDMGFGKRAVAHVLGELQHEHVATAFEPLPRTALSALTPERGSSRG